MVTYLVFAVSREQTGRSRVRGVVFEILDLSKEYLTSILGKTCRHSGFFFYVYGAIICLT